MREEFENKYLLFDVPTVFEWKRQVIVYQFFLKLKEEYSEQIKVVYNLSNQTNNVYKIEKRILGINRFQKNTTPISLEIFDLNSLIGVPFVLKKRYICEPVFLDKYLTNDNELYILEIEDGRDNEFLQKLGSYKCVSGEKEYMNEYMTRPFNSEDLLGLKLLSKCI